MKIGALVVMAAFACGVWWFWDLCEGRLTGNNPMRDWRFDFFFGLCALGALAQAMENQRAE